MKIDFNKVSFSDHARSQMIDRFITDAEVFDAIIHGRVVGWRNGRAIADIDGIVAGCRLRVAFDTKAHRVVTAAYKTPNGCRPENDARR